MRPSIAPLEFRFQFEDYAIIVVVLLLLVGLGIACHKMVRSTSDFLVGGNRMSWWLGGMSVFMGGFSAWTFTGAAGLAYTNGHVAILYFLMGQGAGFIFSAIFIAHRCRQTRKLTTMQIVQGRFGRATEQLILVLQLISAIPMGAIWLTGLALFFSVAFSVPIAPCIIISGTVILVYSTLGGSWAVATSDFFQGVLLVLMVLLVAVLSVHGVGGFNGFVEHLPPHILRGLDSEHDLPWLLAGGLIAFLNFSSIAGAQRYLSVIDGKAARKVALLAAILFIIGPILWFIPPIAASYAFPDLHSSLPNLKHPEEGAYVAMGLTLLPPGLAGLLLMNIFGATLTALDSAVNQTAGFLTVNVYKIWIRASASDRELVFVARAFGVIFGCIVMGLALAVSQSDNSSLLELNLNVQSIVAIPIIVPFFLLWFIRYAPRWAALASVGVGMVVSYLLNKNVYWPSLPYNIEPFLARVVGMEGWAEGRPFPFAVRVFVVLGACIMVFLGTQLFWKWSSKGGRDAVVSFNREMNTAVDVGKNIEGDENPYQFKVSGGLLLVIGGVLLAMGLYGVILDRRAWLTCCFGISAGGIGALMWTHGRGRSRRRRLNIK